MSEYYAVVDYDQLKDGEDILAFGCHVLSWDFCTMGKPSYGIVPVKCDTDALQAEVDRLWKTLHSVYIVCMEADMAGDLPENLDGKLLDEMNKALKGGE